MAERGSVLKRPDSSEIKQFRSAIARLKKAGLVHPGIDARKVEPSRSLNSAIKKFQSVLRGNATVLPLKKNSSRAVNLTQAEAVKRNFQVAAPIGLKRKIIVPHFPSEKVEVKGGSIQFSSAEGIRRLELPSVRTDTVRHFISDLKRSKVRLPDRRKGEVFAARFFTGRTQTYTSLHDLLDQLNVYDSVVAAHGRKQTAEVIRNIEILTIPKADKETWEHERQKDKAVIRERKKAARRAGRKRASKARK